MTDEVQEEVTAPAEGENAVPSITAGDLATMVRLIDAGSQRGAWRGNEMAVIGTLRNKVAAIVEAITPAAPAEGEEGEAPAADEAPAEEAPVAEEAAG